MKTIQAAAAAACLAVLVSCQGPLTVGPGSAENRALDLSGYSLVWSDEFDGTSLNSAVWTAETGGGGWGNNELQYYRAENATVGGGLLTIAAKREAFGGRSFTSARIKSQDKYTVQYGKIVARIKMPSGYGMWPAFWLLGNNISTVQWPACGEIDVAEMAGGQGGAAGDRTVYGTLHWDAGGHAMYGKTYDLGAKLGDAYHDYEAEWDAAQLIVRIDGIEYYRIDLTPSSLDAFRKPFFLLFNLAVGGNFFNPAITDPNAVTAVLPQSMLVDWVRVYKKAAGNGAAVPGTVEAEAFTAQSGIQTEASSEGGQNVGWIDSGDWMDYQLNVQTAGTYQLEYRVAALSAAGTLDFRINGVSKGTTVLPVTGGWQTWQTVSRSVTLAAGTQTLRLAALAGGFNLNWFKLTQAVSSNLLTNPGFETGGATQTPAGWSTWVPAGEVDADFTETYNGARTGSYHLTHYRTSAYKVWTYQIKTGLANGTYTFRAWTRSSGGQAQCYLQAKGYDSSGSYRQQTVPASSGWTQVTISGISVTNGQCEVGFYTDASGGSTSLHVDDAEFFRN